MGFTLGMQRWSNLSDDAVSAIRSFAASHGKRDRGEVLDEAWWDAAGAAVPGFSPFHLSGGYDTAAGAALGNVLDRSLGLQRWKAQRRRVPQVLYLVPFMFLLRDQEPPFWAELRTSGGDPILIGDPVVLLDHWRGRGDATYAARGARLLEALRAGTLGTAEAEPDEVAADADDDEADVDEAAAEADDDAADVDEADDDEADVDEADDDAADVDRTAEQAFVAVEHALYQLLSEAWELRVPVGVYW